MLIDIFSFQKSEISLQYSGISYKGENFTVRNLRECLYQPLLVYSYFCSRKFSAYIYTNSITNQFVRMVKGNFSFHLQHIGCIILVFCQVATGHRTFFILLIYLYCQQTKMMYFYIFFTDFTKSCKLPTFTTVNLTKKKIIIKIIKIQ